ncbi:MAG: hypothetical protein FJ100_21635 [Deltaproteobacteria bacterium]|nr:hypothetical protein [Deltaproteobacteria bacterium]
MLCATRSPSAGTSYDIPNEIDFSAGTRGKSYKPARHLRVPVCLDAEVQQFLMAAAERKGVDLSQLANDLLRGDIALSRP